MKTQDQSAEREAFEKWAREEFVCHEYSFASAQPYGYINTIQSKTFAGRVNAQYADVQMLWLTWRGARANKAPSADEVTKVLRLLDDAIDQYMSLPARGLVVEARAALSAREAPAREGWQPIETAPKDGSHLLVWSGVEVAEARWFGQSGWGVATFNGQVWAGRNPTHWMLMPQAPTTEGSET